MAVTGQNTRRPPARPENYCESKQTYFSYSLDKAFHPPEFQAKLFFTRNWVGGFYWDSLLKAFMWIPKTMLVFWDSFSQNHSWYKPFPNNIGILPIQLNALATDGTVHHQIQQFQ